MGSGHQGSVMPEQEPDSSHDLTRRRSPERQSPRSPGLPPELEDRLLIALDGPASGVRARLQRILDAHPEHAAAIRAWVGSVAEAAMLRELWREDLENGVANTELPERGRP